MIKNFVKILELLSDRLEVCVSVYIYIYNCYYEPLQFEMLNSQVIWYRFLSMFRKRVIEGY